MSIYDSYKKLTKADFAALDDDELQEAALFWTEKYDPVTNQKAFEKAPIPCKNIIAVLMLNGQVENGGFNQFYYNGYLNYSIDYADAFSSIGLTKVAALIDEANMTYHSIKHRLPINDGDIEAFSASYENNPLNDIDERYNEFFEEIETAITQYIKSNIAYFGN